MMFSKISNTSIRWLFAELGVVILGILIAFQIEEYRESRINQATEKRILESLVSELAIDLDNYESFANVLRRQSIAVIGIADVLNKSSYLGRPDELLANFQSATESLRWEPITTTYTGAKETGQLAYISDPSLLEGIIMYYDSTIPKVAYFADRMYIRRNEVLNITALDIYREMSESSSPPGFVGQYTLRTPVESFPSDPKFQGILGLFGQNLILALDSISISRERAKNLQLSIQDYLETL